MNTRTGPAARRFLRVQIAKTTRTDLLCIHCGGFGNARPMFAIIAPGQDTADAQTGIHRKCIALVKAPRAPRRPQPESAIPPAFRQSAREVPPHE